MYCVKCGRKNEEGDLFCAGCGNDLRGTSAPTTKRSSISNQDAVKEKLSAVQVSEGASKIVDSIKGDKKKQLAVVAVVVALIVAVVAINTLSASTPERATMDMMDAYTTETTDEYLDAMSDELRTALAKLCADGDEDGLYDMLYEYSDEYVERCQDSYGKNMTFSYTVKSIDEMAKTEFDDYVDEIDDEYRVDVTDVRLLRVVMEMSGDEDYYVGDYEMTVLEIGGDWVVHWGQ